MTLSKSTFTLTKCVFQSTALTIQSSDSNVILVGCTFTDSKLEMTSDDAYQIMQWGESRQAEISATTFNNSFLEIKKSEGHSKRLNFLESKVCAFFFVVCLDGNNHFDSTIHVKESKVFPCRYKSISLSLNVHTACNHYAFGKYNYEKALTMTRIFFRLTNNWVSKLR